MTKHYNAKSETPKRRALRHSMPKAEVILWKSLSRKQMMGCKFRRQYSVDKYVIDFYCPELKLAVEVDGDSHYVKDAEEYDKERQDYIEQFGITFLRVANNDIYKNLNGVLTTISEKIQEIKKQPPLNPLLYPLCVSPLLRGRMKVGVEKGGD
jgi:very-short-patch-repair endonuclease